jgi:hypothetical protein
MLASCGEAWVRGQRKMSQLLVAFGLLDCYGPFSLGALFKTYEPFISLIFHFLRPRPTAETVLHL